MHIYISFYFYLVQNREGYSLFSFSAFALYYIFGELQLLNIGRVVTSNANLDNYELVILAYIHMLKWKKVVSSILF